MAGAIPAAGAPLCLVAVCWVGVALWVATSSQGQDPVAVPPAAVVPVAVTVDGVAIYVAEVETLASKALGTATEVRSCSIACGPNRSSS